MCKMAYSRENIDEKTEKFTVTFTIKQLKELKKIAKEQNRSVSHFVREAVDDFLKGIKENPF
jgi:mRNA-degrading endonuclease RelE of RelBE toxin-antitoxin system